MALETIRNLKKVEGFEIIHMDDLKVQYPDKFNKESGQMDWKWFENVIRPNKFIYVRHDKNSLSFTIQNGPIRENGVNGCQVDTIIALGKRIIEGLNNNFPCRENQMAIAKLDEALMWLRERTRDRTARGVEGQNKA